MGAAFEAHISERLKEPALETTMSEDFKTEIMSEKYGLRTKLLFCSQAG
jgi:hypothetical protein